ncbi:MAG: TIGR03000 domain-containing protein [Pirellula sp.]
MRNIQKRWLSGSTLVALLLVCANAAQAGFGSSGGYGSSGGGAAAYGSSGGYGAYYGGGSSGGYVGPLRRIGARVHNLVHHRAARAAYGSSGGSVGGGSSGGAYGYGSTGHGSSGGYAIRHSGSTGGGSVGGGSSGGSYYGSSYVTSGSSGHSYAPTYGGSSGSALNYGSYESYSTPMHIEGSYESSGSVVAPEYSPIMSGASNHIQSASKLASNSSIQPNEVHLTVKLPEAAKVYVNGNLTTTKGDVRHFVSRELKENEAYRFEVKAVLPKEDGSEITQNKTVVINSGYGEELTFDLKNTDDPVETVLTLSVPEDAKVILAQNSTKSSGESRVYRTKQLREGEAWDDYKIEVTYKGITKEKTIRLIGGDKLELRFDFESEQSSNKVAMN